MPNKNFSLSAFKANLPFGGARNTLFSVQVTAPPQIGIGLDLQKVPFLTRSASLPSSNLGLIGVPYMGRTLKLAGDRTFDPWSVVVINDEDFKIKNAMEAWSNAINNMRGNIRLGNAANLSYKANATVTQYSKTGDVLRVYTFEGLFPRSVSEISLGWGDTDSIEEFGVTFEYDNWVVDTAGVTGTPGNQG